MSNSDIHGGTKHPCSVMIQVPDLQELAHNIGTVIALQQEIQAHISRQSPSMKAVYDAVAASCAQETTLGCRDISVSSTAGVQLGELPANEPHACHPGHLQCFMSRQSELMQALVQSNSQSCLVDDSVLAGIGLLQQTVRQSVASSEGLREILRRFRMGQKNVSQNKMRESRRLRASLDSLSNKIAQQLDLQLQSSQQLSQCCERISEHTAASDEARTRELRQAAETLNAFINKQRQRQDQFTDGLLDSFRVFSTIIRDDIKQGLKQKGGSSTRASQALVVPSVSSLMLFTSNHATHETFTGGKCLRCMFDDIRLDRSAILCGSVVSHSSQTRQCSSNQYQPSSSVGFSGQGKCSCRRRSRSIWPTDLIQS